MTRRPRLLRTAWLLAAIVQIVLPAFASVADGHAEATSARATTTGHVEEFGATGCARQHPDDCVVCRYLTLGATRSAAPTVPAVVERTILARHPDYVAQRCAARSPGDPPQRAPPV